MRYALKNHKIVQDSIMLDYQALITYIVEGLKGDFSKYSQTENRVVIK